MNRKVLAAIILTSTLTCSLSNVSFAEPLNNSQIQLESNTNITPRVAQYVWTNTALNVRTGPGTQYSIVKTLPKDTRLWITFAQYDKYGNDWYRYAENRWVCANYVRYSK